jgi:hypothetical protein
MMSDPAPDLEAIVYEMREVDALDHYDGSGWHGFKAAVRAWLEARGASMF